MQESDSNENPYEASSVPMKRDVKSMRCPSCGSKMVEGLVRFNSRAWFLPGDAGLLRRLFAWGGKKVHSGEFFALFPSRRAARCERCQTVVISS